MKNPETARADEWSDIVQLSDAFLAARGECRYVPNVHEAAWRQGAGFNLHVRKVDGRSDGSTLAHFALSALCFDRHHPLQKCFMYTQDGLVDEQAIGNPIDYEMGGALGLSYEAMAAIEARSYLLGAMADIIEKSADSTPE